MATLLHVGSTEMDGPGLLTTHLRPAPSRQSVKPLSVSQAHAPLVQTWLTPQAFPQAPQLARFVLVFCMQKRGSGHLPCRLHKAQSLHMLFPCRLHKALFLLSVLLTRHSNGVPVPGHLVRPVAQSAHCGHRHVRGQSSVLSQMTRGAQSRGMRVCMHACSTLTNIHNYKLLITTQQALTVGGVGVLG